MDVRSLQARFNLRVVTVWHCSSPSSGKGKLVWLRVFFGGVPGITAISWGCRVLGFQRDKQYHACPRDPLYFISQVVEGGLCHAFFALISYSPKSSTLAGRKSDLFQGRHVRQSAKNARLGWYQFAPLRPVNRNRNQQPERYDALF